MEKDCEILLRLIKKFLKKQKQLFKALNKDFGISSHHLFPAILKKANIKMEDRLKSKPHWTYRAEGIGYRFRNSKNKEEILFDFGFFDRYDGFDPRFVLYYIQNEAKHNRLGASFNEFFEWKDVYYKAVNMSFPAIFQTKKFDLCINRLIKEKYLELEKKEVIKKALARHSIGCFNNLYLTAKARLKK